MTKAKLPATIRRTIVVATLAGAIIIAVAALGAANAWQVWVASDTQSLAASKAVAKGEPAIVARVIDGDTLSVQLLTSTDTARVRLIGIDTPEIGYDTAPDECYAEDARTILEILLPVGTEVSLLTDPSQLQEDKYGRLLRHVEDTASGTNVAMALLESCAGREYTFNQPYAGRQEYLEAETLAQNQSLGYWGACQ